MHPMSMGGKCSSLQLKWTMAVLRFALKTSMTVSDVLTLLQLPQVQAQLPREQNQIRRHRQRPSRQMRIWIWASSSSLQRPSTQRSVLPRGEMTTAERNEYVLPHRSAALCPAGRLQAARILLPMTCRLTSSLVSWTRSRVLRHESLTERLCKSLAVSEATLPSTDGNVDVP